MILSTVNDTCRISRDFEALRKLEVFSGTPAEVIKLFAYLARRRKYAMGEPIIIQGEKAARAYFLTSGEIEISTMYKDRKIMIQHLKGNHFFGELALLAEFTWFFSARAVTDAEILIIDRESFKKILEKFPEKRDRIIEKLIQFRVSRFEQHTIHLLDRIIEQANNGKPINDSIII